jgi:hypothetical protein
MLFHALVSILCTGIFPKLLQLYNQRVTQRSMESLTALWSFANLSLGIVLMSTWIVEKLRSTFGAMLIVALTGVAWALTAWAPFTLVS